MRVNSHCSMICDPDTAKPVDKMLRASHQETALPLEHLALSLSRSQPLTGLALSWNSSNHHLQSSAIQTASLDHQILFSTTPAITTPQPHTSPSPSFPPCPPSHPTPHPPPSAKHSSRPLPSPAYTTTYNPRGPTKTDSALPLHLPPHSHSLPTHYPSH